MTAMEQYFVTAIIALAGAVAALWGWQVKVYRHINVKLDECERDRAELHEKIEEILGMKK